MRSNMKFNMFVSVGIVFSTQLLSGCGSNTETEFLEKLKAKVGAEGERCYSVDNFLDLKLLGEEKGEQFLSVMSGSIMNFYKEKQENGRKMLDKLAQVKYVDMSRPKKLKYNFQMYDGYKLTDKGRENITWDKGVCVGSRVVKNIVEYTEPSDMGGMTFSEVTYKYDVDFNDIVSDLGLEEKIKSKLSGDDKAVFIKTNKGWSLK